ncbi:electron transporter SenC [Parafrankia colletiae]|uniref:Electron transporter SenC n=1 Tax=Parafrankia colletiae TaxID=573497 RepID=A0A1S1QG49_9ACTN|nr:SCO family protein [Parafrankia colletiae]MCK9900070.1 SCO family protein [Frankia sp. Cpl3]OHV33773.1 electron transporter SenC [Parafrankia colletiae]
MPRRSQTSTHHHHTTGRSRPATTPSEGSAPDQTGQTGRSGHVSGPGGPGRAGRIGHPRRRCAGLAFAAVLALGATLGACSNGDGGAGVTIVDVGDGTNEGLHGVIPTERFAKPALGLTDTEDRPFDLRTRTQGKITLLFFGYTMCPDVCPTTMADVAAALDEVDQSVRDQVSVVFVSTDPERDTAPVLDRWLNQFDESFIGVRGPFEKVKAQAEAIGVALEEPRVQADGSVLVAHGSQVIAFGRDARARVLYLAGTPVADYVADLPVLTAERLGPDESATVSPSRTSDRDATPGPAPAATAGTAGAAAATREVTG